MDREAHLLSQFEEDERTELVPLNEIDGLRTSRELSDVIEFLKSASEDGRPIHKSSVRLELIGRRWPRLIPIIWTLRRDADGEYVYGVVGQDLVDAGGFARRGKLLREVGGSQLIIDMLEHLRAAKKVWYRIGKPKMQHRIRVSHLEVITVPIIDDSGDVVTFLNFTRYFWDGPEERYFF